MNWVLRNFLLWYLKKSLGANEKTFLMNALITKLLEARAGNCPSAIASRGNLRVPTNPPPKCGEMLFPTTPWCNSLSHCTAMPGNNTRDGVQYILEARAGIAPAHRGFADPCLTTWLPSHLLISASFCKERVSFFEKIFKRMDVRIPKF